MKQILERVMYFEALDEKYIPFVKETRQFAKTYEDEQILILIEDFMKGTSY